MAKETASVEINDQYYKHARKGRAGYACGGLRQGSYGRSWCDPDCETNPWWN